MMRVPPRFRLRTTLLLGWALVPAWAMALPVHVPRPRGEYEVKAAFLCNFAHFVTWPGVAAAGDTLVIGIVGRDPFGRVMDDLFVGKAGAGRPVAIRRFPSLDDLSSCHILFIGATSESALPGALRRLRSMPVLTVGEQEGFLAAGGMIRLKTVGDRVRFDVNLPAANSAHLRLSANLLRVADTVLGQAPTGGGQ